MVGTALARLCPPYGPERVSRVQGANGSFGPTAKAVRWSEAYHPTSAESGFDGEILPAFKDRFPKFGER